MIYNRLTEPCSRIPLRPSPQPGCIYCLPGLVPPHMHFTPMYWPWLNVVARCFAAITKSVFVAYLPEDQ